MNNISGVKIQLKNGNYSLKSIDFPNNISSLNQATMTLPGGVYTTFRTYDQNKIIFWNKHIERLNQSAKLEGRTIEIDKIPLRIALKEFVNRQITDLRIRILISIFEDPITIHFLSEELIPVNPKAYNLGVEVVTTRTIRENPKAKRTDFINQQINFHLGPEVNEAIIEDKAGNLLEGYSSNLFAIIKGIIYTENDSVLHGITRSIVLEEAAKCEIPIIFTPININNLHEINEMFITSTSRAVLPVIKINREIVGDGTPGHITKLMLKHYLSRLETDLENL